MKTFIIIILHKVPAPPTVLFMEPEGLRPESGFFHEVKG